MTRRVVSFLILACLSGPAVYAQSSPCSRLLITAQGPGVGQSLLFAVDTASGAVTTLLDQTLGTITDITMDRDNIGYTLAYVGSTESGLHFLGAEKTRASLVRTERLRTSSVRFTCVDLTSEDYWLVGAAQCEGYGRLHALEPEDDQFRELDSFAGADVAKIVVERTAARILLGMNRASGAALVSYDCLASHNRATTLVAGLGTIADLVQEPWNDGFLVATRDPWAPLVYAGFGSTQNTAKTFTLPAARFPSGLAVEAMAFDMRPDNAGKHPLWVLSVEGLYRFTWDPGTKSLEPPEILPTYRVSSARPTAMIFEGDRDYLLTSPRVEDAGSDIKAVLALRLGPQCANRPYVLAASLAMSPGITISPTRMINLRPDPLLLLSLSGQLAMIFDNFQGETGPDGEVTGRLVARKEWCGLLPPITIYFAGIVVDPAFPGHIRAVTNTVGVTLF
ncbi:MAG: hypothetical protein JXQ29_15220 [Planctomycetes bacterium]|nr:hypothetical protein [Planctomycetota bacterium]